MERSAKADPATPSTPAEHADALARQPPPDPSTFGMPTEDDGVRTDPLLGQNLISCTHGHAGFLGGGYGRTGDPDAFAATLRQVLALQDDADAFRRMG